MHKRLNHKTACVVRQILNNFPYQNAKRRSSLEIKRIRRAVKSKLDIRLSDKQISSFQYQVNRNKKEKLEPQFVLFGPAILKKFKGKKPTAGFIELNKGENLHIFTVD